MSHGKAAQLKGRLAKDDEWNYPQRVSKTCDRRTANRLRRRAEKRQVQREAA